MSSYVTSTYYKDTYHGTLIPDSKLTSYLGKASDAIDQKTYSRIIAISFDELTSIQQYNVQMAVCTHADDLYAVADTPNGVSSYNINGVSMSFKNKSEISSQAMGYLNVTGLNFRGL